MDNSSISNALPSVQPSLMLPSGQATSMEQLKAVSRLVIRRREINGERSMLASTVMIRNPRALVAHRAGFEVFRDRHGGVDIRVQTTTFACMTRNCYGTSQWKQTSPRKRSASASAACSGLL